MISFCFYKIFGCLKISAHRPADKLEAAGSVKKNTKTARNEFSTGVVFMSQEDSNMYSDNHRIYEDI